MSAVSHCIYCPDPADSKEHPLPAAFGEFTNAPYLQNRICKTCNNTHLGILDEQLARCGPEAFLRRHYGVQGRSTHDEVNPFYRGSAGGNRLEMKALDPQLGIEVLLECENGTYRQARQLIFVEKSGKIHHLPIREGTSPEQLRGAYEQLGVSQPFDVHILYDKDKEDWVERLIKETWSKATFGKGGLGGNTYQGVVTTVVLTDRYFRAIAKIGFHYFLTQFPKYSGHEPMFSDVRRYILEGGGAIDRANAFIGKRQHPLLREMLTPGARPDGWRAHVLSAEIKPGECLAHVQMFISEDWPAPAYTIRLANDSILVECQAAGHAYVYYADGPRGQYSGEALNLETTRTDFPAPPVTPIIT
jgi:hypothetical protein